MINQLKFRAWDNGEMLKSPLDEYFGISRFFGFLSDNTILMFSTGLKSSDAGCGLPVSDSYFGDIIKFYDTDGKEHHAEIIWYEKELCIGFRRLSDGFIYTQRLFNDSGYFQPSKIQFQIIGNIFENPDLLK